jgi:hypothetical protein
MSCVYGCYGFPAFCCCFTASSTGRVAQRCFFLTWAHWSSIPLLQLAEGDSGVPHPSVLRVRIFFRYAFSEGYAQSSQASLRARRSSFRYLQLLSAETAARDGSREESLREDSGGSAATACVPLNRICGDAGTRTSAAQRTGQEESIIEGAPHAAFAYGCLEPP